MAGWGEFGVSEAEWEYSGEGDVKTLSDKGDEESVVPGEWERLDAEGCCALVACDESACVWA